MKGLRRLLDRHAGLAATLLALTLALRALVPTGYMPASEHGRFAVRICGAQVAHSMAHGQHGQPERSHADQPCAFAGLSAPAGPPPPALVVPVAPRTQTAFVAARHAAAALTPSRSHPPARGPPVLA